MLLNRFGFAMTDLFAEGMFFFQQQYFVASKAGQKLHLFIICGRNESLFSWGKI